jgi:hypothetical protein
MAATRYPLITTYSERQVDDGADPRIKNAYIESVQESEQMERYVTKRPGLAAFDDTASVAEGRGLFVWQGDVYAVVGNQIFRNGAALAGTLATATGRVYFDEAADGTGLLVFHDGANLYTVNPAGTLVNEADPQIPTTILPGIVVLDQFCFLGTNDVNNEIHNSDVGDVTSWTDTFVVSEVRSDPGVAIARYINYLVSFNEETIEFFFDAANSPGTPLDRFEGMASLVGCASGATVVNIDQSLVFVAKSSTGGRFVGHLKGEFNPVRISTQAIDEYLDQEGAAISDAFAFFIRHAGHSLYVLTLPTTADKTFVYDLDEGAWYQWSSDVSATETHFTGIAADNIDGQMLILDEDNGRIYEFDAEVFQDNTPSVEDILYEVVTRKFDSTVRMNKFVNRLYPVGDVTAGTATLNISWSDDDYQTFEVNRPLDLSIPGNFITRCGFFQRRAWRLQFVANEPVRIIALEGDQTTGYYAR